MLIFDHGKLARRQPRELKRFRRWLLEAERGTVSAIAITHDEDGNCCRLEPWRQTASAIINALRPPVQQVFFNLVKVS